MAPFSGDSAALAKSNPAKAPIVPHVRANDAPADIWRAMSSGICCVTDVLKMRGREAADVV